MAGPGTGVKGHHASVAVVDEIQSAEDLQAEAMAGLQRRIPPPRLIPCPFCQAGVSVSAYSQLWGHVCWICSGWAVVPADKQFLRGPIAPHPRRQIR